MIGTDSESGYATTLGEIYVYEQDEEPPPPFPLNVEKLWAIGIWGGKMLNNREDRFPLFRHSPFNSPQNDCIRGANK